MAKVVVHRQFPGYAHGQDETCWCRPMVVDALDETPSSEIVKVIDFADDEPRVPDSHTQSERAMH